MVRLTLVLVHLVVLLAVADPPAAAVTEPTPVGTWPLSPEPEVLATFAPPADPWGAGHRGVDLAGHPGQVVSAALPGVVRFAGRTAGKGVVTVAHDDGTRTTYEPVAATVRTGARVTGGSAIGRLEVSFSHCFPAACLHWGWIDGETYRDPLLLVGGGPVRLLPLWRDEPVVAGRAALPYAAWTPPLAALPLAVLQDGGRHALVHLWVDSRMTSSGTSYADAPMGRATYDVLARPSGPQLRRGDGPDGRPGGAGRS